MSSIRPEELDDRLDRGAAPFVLDIRPHSDYQRTAIDGSHNVPVYHDLRGGDDAALRAHLNEIPRGEDVVVVCKMGVVAKRATSVLDAAGYDAATLAGGISGWKGYQNDSVGYKIRSLIWDLKSAV
ncbi:rhodanese-like domain-containing protein [Halobaculum gomorrense]|uniref:Rhodanese-related sulfurtransferase n=1 Tax=Halobaculum gomorrense TaxID=43928 RepID=A0A1M5UKZ8_9EURY|nr:rhodanese-like domain-containing protein [Halobaculum gomorrense]SHH63526.1 Rhodanese-related sulfurtransferase [Halobaculum gomorrense]